MQTHRSQSVPELGRLFALEEAFGLGGVSVVAFDNAAEFAFTTNLALCTWTEVDVENGVVSTDSSMRSFVVIVAQPGCCNIVELSSAEADEVVKTLLFDGSDERLREGVRFRRFDGCSDASNVLGFPKVVEGMREFTVPVSNQEFDFDSFVLRPHGNVACLLHHPGSVRMICRVATVDAAAPEMNEHQNVGRELAA